MVEMPYSTQPYLQFQESKEKKYHNSITVDYGKSSKLVYKHNAVRV